MFNLFKSKTSVGEKIVFKLGGMHCTSCAMNIDGALEDTDGVISANTNYAKAQVVIEYNQSKITKEKLVSIIEDQGYTVV